MKNSKGVLSCEVHILMVLILHMSNINEAVANLTNEFMHVVEHVLIIWTMVPAWSSTHRCQQFIHGMEELASAYVIPVAVQDQHDHPWQGGARCGATTRTHFQHPRERRSCLSRCPDTCIELCRASLSVPALHWSRYIVVCRSSVKLCTVVCMRMLALQ
jgi:hypothetical protein